mmetsp:Transcript_39795/g.92071  ORF Transcript_39795/g.92071 Transcript_39795/m.92071 type:complete len:89 (-) Transcript_39795:6-272(-)
MFMHPPTDGIREGSLAKSSDDAVEGRQGTLSFITSASSPQFRSSSKSAKELALFFLLRDVAFEKARRIHPCFDILSGAAQAASKDSAT